MDPQSKQKLDEILAKEIGILSEEEKGFLRARRSYLTASEAEKYSEILGAKKEEDEPKKKTGKVKK